MFNSLKLFVTSFNRTSREIYRVILSRTKHQKNDFLVGGIISAEKWLYWKGSLTGINIKLIKYCDSFNKCLLKQKEICDFILCYKQISDFYYDLD